MALVNNRQVKGSEAMKKKYVAGVIFFAFLILPIVLLAQIFSGGQNVTTLQTIGPVAKNFDRSSFMEDEFVFFSGSAFASYNPESEVTEILTDYEELPSVVNISYLNRSTAIIETANHDPGSRLYSQLFNNSDTVRAIGLNHFWLVDIANDSYVRLSDIAGSQINAISKNGQPRFSGLNVSEELTTTSIFETTEDGIQEIANLPGTYRVIDSIGDYSVLLSDGYYTLRHSDMQLIKIEEALAQDPLLLSTGELVVRLEPSTTEEGARLLRSQDFEESLGGVFLLSSDLSSLEKISNANGSFIKLAFRDSILIASALESSELVVEVIEFNIGNRQKTYEIEGLDTDIQAAYYGDASEIFLVDSFGDLHVALESPPSGTTLAAAARLSTYCEKDFCIDPDGSRSARVNIYSGSLSDVRPKVLRRLENQGVNPVFINIGWIDQTAL